MNAPLVSGLFHVSSIGGETVKQGAILANAARNAPETKSLKSLANMVLQRNRARNIPETRLFHHETVVKQKSNTPETEKTLAETPDPVEDVPDPAEVLEREGMILANGHTGPWADEAARLFTMRRPSAYTPQRWQEILNDAGVFLDRWGKQAHALGWSPVDTFGFDPVSPHANPGTLGLVLLLEGRPVIALTADSATIECGKGVTTRFFRSSGGREVSIPLWSMEGGKHG